MGENKIACEVSFRMKKGSLSFRASLKKNISVLIMFFIEFFISVNKATENSKDVVRTDF